MRSNYGTFGFQKLIVACGVLLLMFGGTALAQKMPSSAKGPSVAAKAPLRGNPGDYVGSETCAGCHRAEATSFFKTPHAELGEAPKPAEAAPGAEESSSVAAGRKLYNDMMCSGCHQIGGKGGKSAPALDDVGVRRTRDELMDRMLKRRAGTIMPILPPDTPTENLNHLVDYMMTLKGQPPAAAPAVAAAPKFVTGCESCHGPGKAHADHQMEAAGDAAKEAEGAKLIFRFDASPKENSERCLVCHDSGKPQSSFGHSNHLAAGVSCQECHVPHLVKVASVPKRDPAPVKLASAQSRFFSVPELPEQTRWLHNSLLKESEPGLCFSCHRTVQGQFALPEHHRVPEGFMKCTDCHNPHGSQNHFQLTKSNWETCVKCHAEKRGPYVYEHAVVRVEGCAACHTPHGSINNFLLKRREERLLCLQCHAVIHTGPTSGFRDQANVPHSRGGYQASGPCTRCHVQVHGSNFDEFLLK